MRSSFRLYFRVGRGRTHSDQVANALDLVQLADFLGRVQLLLIEINRAGQSHNAVLGARLQVAEFLLFRQLLRYAGLDVAVVAGARGLRCQPGAENAYRKK